MFAKIKLFVGLLLLLFISYLGFYIYNSFSGGYWPAPVSDGTKSTALIRLLDFPDAIVWQPRWGYYTRDEADFLGEVFKPLIKLDRKFIHPTHYLTEPEFIQWAKDTLIDHVHPQFANESDYVKRLINMIPH